MDARSGHLKHFKQTLPFPFEQMTEGTMRMKGVWLIELPPLATPPVDETLTQHAAVDVCHDAIRDELRLRFASAPQTQFYIYTVSGMNFPAARKRSIQYGGRDHIKALAAEILEKGFDVYTDLCNNISSIDEIHILSSGSGSFFALRIIQLIQTYGMRLHRSSNPTAEFSFAWSKLLAPSTKKEPPEAGRYKVVPDLEAHDELATLLKSLILVEPSLPIPRRVFRLRWSAPAFYADTDVDALKKPPILLNVFVKHESPPERLDIPVNCGVDEMASADEVKQIVWDFIERSRGETMRKTFTLTSGTAEGNNATILSLSNPLTTIPVHNISGVQELVFRARHCLEAYCQRSQQADLYQSIEFFRRAVPASEDDQLGLAIKLDLCDALLLRSEDEGKDSDLEESLTLANRVISQAGVAHLLHVRSRRILAKGYILKAERGTEYSDGAIEIALSHLNDCIGITERSQSDEAILCLVEHARAILLKGGSKNDTKDIHTATSEIDKAIQLVAPGHHLRPYALFIHAYLQLACHYCSESTEDIKHAINHIQESVELSPRGFRQRTISLNLQGRLLWVNYQIHGKLEDLDRAIQSYEEATKEKNIVLQHVVRGNLYELLFQRSKDRSQLVDLESAIVGFRSVLGKMPSDHPFRPHYTSILAQALEHQFSHYGQISSLDTAFELQKHAVEEALPNFRYYSLRNLALAYHTRFGVYGQLSDLDEAVRLIQEAEVTCQNRDIQSRLHLVLGDFLITRFNLLREIDDINKAISTLQDSLEYSHDNAPSIGKLFIQRFVTNPVSNISTLQSYLDLEYGPGKGSSQSSVYRSSLGNAFLQRFVAKNDPNDLSSAIALQQQAISGLPPHHSRLPLAYYTLGGAYDLKFLRTRTLQDIQDAIEAYNRAVDLTRKGHSFRSMYLFRLGSAKHALFTVTQDREDLLSAAEHLLQAAQDQCSPVRTRFDAAALLATISHKRRLMDEAWRSYRIAMELLPKLTWTWKGNNSRVKESLGRDPENFIQDAGACAIALGHLEIAVEWLDQRSLIWNTSQNLRHDLLRLRETHASLAEEFESTCAALDFWAFRSESPPIVDVEKGADGHGVLLGRWQALTDSVRAEKGFETFLGPFRFSELQSAASGGIVIILNFSNFRCDVLLLTEGQGIKVLPAPRASPQEMDRLAHHLLAELQKDKVPGDRETPEEEAGLRDILRSLWDYLGAPIWETISGLNIGINPHVWWCPAGVLSRLPFHACGPFDNVQPGMADLVVSSYIPTLSSLLRSKRRRASSKSPPPFDLLAIGLDNGANIQKSDLPSVSDDLAVLKHLRRRGTVMALQGSEVTVSRVSQLMVEKSWLHVATHSVRQPHSPLESCLILYDGSLTLSFIAQQRLPQAEFAYLSTSHASERLPEEMFHIPGAFLSAGYRGVVTTLWSIDEEDAPKVAEAFYRHLTRRETDPDAMATAEALHMATSALRQSQVSLRRWVPFVHFGA